ncbi:conserved hypothetical protein [Xanthomonas citri pv. citri]|nr:conserved hypothetical protein [Xanthomonas citri pv. citri]
MALTATVRRAELQISDMDRGYYANHSLTLAQHPSETDERLMVRLLAFALFADDRLEFGRGLSNDDEPDLWRRDYTGDPDLWIDLGQPDESRVRKACNRSREAVVIGYGGQATEALGALIQRGMRFDVIIQDGEVQMLADHGSVTLTPMVRQAPAE